MPSCAREAGGITSCWAVSGRGQLAGLILLGDFVFWVFFFLHLQHRCLLLPHLPFFLLPLPQSALQQGKNHPYMHTSLIPRVSARNAFQPGYNSHLSSGR